MQRHTTTLWSSGRLNMNVTEIFETMEYGPAPESPTLVLDWLKERQPFGLFINGQWVKPASGKYLDTINPSTGKPLAQVAAANSKDVDAAVPAPRPPPATCTQTPRHTPPRYL